MNAIEILKPLIAQKTYVSDTQTERDGILLLAKLCRELFPTLPQELQDIGNNRYNLYIGSKNPEFFVVGHIDTVLPTEGWSTDPFILTERKDRLYGLGTADMKGSIAAFLAALNTLKKNISLDKIGILIYADEEYDFLGMKQFIATSKKINPKLVLSLDGSLELASGCRGCIELTMRIETITGHSRKACFGNSAIKAAVTACNIVEQQLFAYQTPELGPTTCNLAAIKSGIITRKETGEEIWKSEGNMIPKDAEFVFEVRPTSSDITAETVITQLTQALELQQARIVKTKVRHDLAPLPVAYDSETIKIMEACYQKAGVPFTTRDRTFSGYIDMAMLTAITNAPMVIIGTGGVGHIPNESIAIEDLRNAERIYAAILTTYLEKISKK